MKRIFTYIISAVASVSLLASCDLDIYPISSIAYDEDAQLIQTAANLTALENGLLQSYRTYQMGEFTIASEVEMDCFNATIDYGNNYGGIHKTDYNFTSSDYYVEDYWSYSYSAIKNYNIFIASADNVSDDLKEAAAVAKGEAYFLRAATYLNLARHFGKAYKAASAGTDLCVPLVLVYDQAEKPARATVQAVYEQIKADLDQAATLLAGVKGEPRKDRPSIDAVNALYARYYLDIADYKNAAAFAHKVIDTNAYTLAATAEAMTAEYVNDEGTEPIYQVHARLAEGTNANVAYTYYQADDTKGKIFRPYFIPTKTVIDAYDAGDLRFGAWFDNKEWVLMNGSFVQGQFYVFTKYWGNPALTSNLRNGRQAPKPFMIGEQYLIAAEAELAAGNAAAAKADLNVLQAARAATQTEATVDNIRKEWLRETVGEGYRMTCLKRWGIGYNKRPMQTGAENIVNTGDVFDGKVFKADDYHFQWPIPSHERKINKNLVQNDGYDISE
ncbi:MAG: RagB/SusD family nutrient uptake outer membrane protein [Bacteroidales bacterium]|nr:RagB/SusD family nutrient uptake outer membrane protein [Bacteroidales bacterium]